MISELASHFPQEIPQAHVALLTFFGSHSAYHLRIS